MARRPDVEYIRYYTDGSAARQLELKPKKKHHPLPKVKKQPKRTLYIQPVAVAGILLSAVLLVMMAVGSVELHHAKQQERAMEKYVQTLRRENAIDRAEYEETLNVEEIERAALALGMIPQEQAERITISIPMPEAVEEPSFWEKTIVFLEGLFA